MSSTQIALLKKYDLAVRGFIGQNLLVDPNVQRNIVEVVDPRPDEWILEIGPGLGALTAQILSAGARVIAVEKDKRFCEILQGELGADYKGKLLIENADVLKTDLGKLLKRVSSLRGAPKGRRSNLKSKIASASSKMLPRNDGKIKVVSNLPYYITSPALFWLIENRSSIEKSVLMMQREVAKRIMAQPGDKDYSRLTLGIRYYADVHRAFEVSRNCFTPKPDVDSTVVVLDFYPPSKLPKGLDEELFFHIVKTAFGARRKTLLNRLTRDSRIGKSREELLRVLNQLSIPENARAEDLLLKDFMTLTLALSLEGREK